MASAQSIEDFYQELHLVGQDQGQINIDLKDVLFALLSDVLPFVDAKAVLSLAEKIVKDGEAQIEANLHQHLSSVFASLRPTRQTSQIETDLSSFVSFGPSNEVGSLASDIHLRRCEALVAGVLAKSDNIRGWINPDPGKIDLIRSVIYLDTKRPQFKAKHDDFKRRGPNATEVMLWCPFRLDTAAESLLTRQRSGGSDDHKSWLREPKNLFKALITRPRAFDRTSRS